MKKYAGYIIVILFVTGLLAAHAAPSETLFKSNITVHNAHVGVGTANLNCDTCHGFPPKYPLTVNSNAQGPGHYIVCEQCHAPPPDSMKPSNGNLIVIHLSRGLYCTNCHNADNITPTHPSTKADNGTIQVIKCENCHRDAEKLTSHMNGGKYCLNCHGNKTSVTSTVATGTPTTVPAQILSVTTNATSAGRTVVKLDRYQGFISATPPIKVGDEVIWTNDGTYPVTLVSVDNLFEPNFLDNGKRISYIFKNPGTYNFYLNENTNAKGTIIVESLVSSSTPFSTPASTITSVSTVPAQTPKKRAQLQVTYEVEPKKNLEAVISVHLKNIGNATATKVNMIIANPPELQVSVRSGSEQRGNTIAWYGEIEPGKEHVAQYIVKGTNSKNTISVPLNVSYVKISREEKAQLLGMSPSAVEGISPEETELITLILNIILRSIPGFEGLTVIVAIMMIGAWRLKKQG